MSDEKRFKQGDLVRLKSGTDEMTVSKVEGDDVHVTWMKDGKVFEHVFKQAMLAPPIDPLDGENQDSCRMRFQDASRSASA